MFNIFLDTQVYETKQFNFLNKDILRLKRFIDDGIVELFITPITIKEIEDHIRREIQHSRQFINGLKENAKILLNYEIYKPIWDRQTIKQAEIKLLEDFRRFLVDINVNEVTISGTYVNQIFESYFEGMPPFSSKKKDEFPDAFAIYSLLEWAENKEQVLYVVSGDNDFKDFCYDKQNLHHIESLEKVLDYINQQDEVKYQLAQKLCEEQIDEFLEAINDTIGKEDFEFKIGVYEVYDVEDVEIKEFTIEGIGDFPDEFLILELQENKLTVVIKIIFKFTIAISEIDPTMSPFDSEAGMYLHIEYEEKEHTEEIELPVEIELNIKDYENQDYTIESIKVNNDAGYLYTVDSEY
ncbi:PIN domain-containing protein [Bacillus altitudinis]|uniref:PIN domain-containing protein n=1 Tax=Bacillus TaxID=1386 RepID=UPI000260A5FD|nr:MULTISPECIES: PIN domain-containing protein [Bacillus]EIL85356.1 hypothetical protein BAME_13790 [Bacillus sp. M 2-6]MEC0472824.1 PIN domain-containing protein [Bacillus altitudinis]NQW95319.1 DUF4935 domain-containing protein [Bacillus stratosphericus]